MVYMYITVYCLHLFLKNKEQADEVRWKMTKLKEEEMKQSHMEEFIFALQEDLRANGSVSCTFACVDSHGC